jgi:hypothetical protein
VTTRRAGCEHLLDEANHQQPESIQGPWPVPAPPLDAADPALIPDPQPTRSPAQQCPLVAVCSLCGGAGASTLAYLIARSSAREAEAAEPPVLALDAGGTTGGLSLYSRAMSSRSLAELAGDIRAGRASSTPMFTTDAGGVRLIASIPRLQPEPDLTVVARILADARQAHRITVADCGTLSLPIERQALEQATHVFWILPATEHGLRRARISLQHAVRPEAVQVVVARHDPSGRRASTRALASLAKERHATLVLMPHVKDLGGKSLDGALEVCSVTLQALATKLKQ